MKEDQLIAFLTARGVDFEHVAGSSAVTRVVGTRGAGSLSKEERKLKIPAVRDTVSGNQTRVYRKPAFSHQELALAAKGCEAQPWLAIAYSVASDWSARPLLFNELDVEAAHFARTEGWPRLIHDVDGHELYYRDRLIDLMLDEEAHRGRFVQAVVTVASRTMRC